MQHDRLGLGLALDASSWLLGGAVGLVAFLFWEANVASHPLVPFRIFKSRSLSTANLMMLLVGGAFFAMWYFLTFYFQSVLGYDAVRAGFAFLPMALAIIAGAQISSRLISAHRRAAAAAGRLVDGDAGLPVDLAHQVRQLLRVATILVPSMRLRLRDGPALRAPGHRGHHGVDRADAGLASGLLNTSRQVGGSLALAALATAAADRTATFMQPGLCGGARRRLPAGVPDLGRGHAGRARDEPPGPAQGRREGQVSDQPRVDAAG